MIEPPRYSSPGPRCSHGCEMSLVKMEHCTCGICENPCDENHYKCYTHDYDLCDYCSV